MRTSDMITDFILRKDSYVTPLGTFTDHSKARAAYPDQNLDRYHVVTMSTVHSLLKAINAQFGKLAEEYSFSLDFDLVGESGLKAKPGVSPSLIPQDFHELIAYAVEGGSEGYYVHIGALLPDGRYMQFGIAKTWNPDSAYELAKQTGRFLAAARWN
jgi:hypothetical protein